MTAENQIQEKATDQEMLDNEQSADQMDTDGTGDSLLPKLQVHVDNKLFKDYYIMQGIVSVEELDKFIQHVKQPLPFTFRLAGDSSNVQDSLKIIKQLFVEKSGVSLFNLPWFYDNRAWQLNSDEACANQNKAISEFKQFIHQESCCGNVSQQDALNLLPAVLLDVKPSHKILDVNAGSGQVVSQLLDIVNNDGKQMDPDGFILVSEADYRLCHELADRMPRLSNPNLAIVNLNYALLQDLRLPTEDSKSEVVRYDRILCHLPSSGDGMFRKNVDGLRSWSAYGPFTYHGSLCQALYSSLSQLAVGGRLVFYTDSINPVENEAVLCTVMTQQRGSVQLVDISSEMPKILYEKGLQTWKVMVKGPKWFREFSEVPETLRDQVWETMFAPSTQEEAQQFHLERCVRILPHRQDTAGLFIAVLTRTETLEQCWKREQEQYQAWLKAEEAKAAAEKAAAEKAAAEKAAAEKAAAEKAAAEKAAAEKAAAAVAEDKQAETDSGETSNIEETKESDDKTNKPAKEETPKADKESVAAVKGEQKEESDHKMDVDDQTDVEAGFKESKMASDKATAAVSHSHPEQATMLASLPESMNPYYAFGQAYGDVQPAQLKEDPLVFLTESDPLWLRIRDFFGLSEDFPLTQLAVRSKDNRSAIFYLSSSLKSLTLSNQNSCNFVCAGEKVFCRVSVSDDTFNYRLNQEGLSIMYPHLKRRVVLLPKQDFIAVLSSYKVDISSLTKEAQKELNALDSGNVVFIYKVDGRLKKQAPHSRLMISGWKDESCCRLFLPAYLRQHYLLSCGGDFTPTAEELPPSEAAKEALTAFVAAMSAMEQ